MTGEEWKSRYLTCNVDFSAVSLSIVCVSSWSLRSCSRIRSLYWSKRLFSDADNDSSEDPFTRSPWGLGVTALMTIPVTQPHELQNTQVDGGRWDKHDMQQSWERSEMHTKCWPKNLKRENLLEDISIDGKMILKWILKIQDGMTWIWFIWLRRELMVIWDHYYHTQFSQGNKFWSISHIDLSQQCLIYGQSLQFNKNNPTGANIIVLRPWKEVTWVMGMAVLQASLFLPVAVLPPAQFALYQATQSACC